MGEPTTETYPPEPDEAESEAIAEATKQRTLIDQHWSGSAVPSDEWRPKHSTLLDPLGFKPALDAAAAFDENMRQVTGTLQADTSGFEAALDRALAAVDEAAIMALVTACTPPGATPLLYSRRKGIARAILASPWLAADRQRVAREAVEEALDGMIVDWGIACEPGATPMSYTTESYARQVLPRTREGWPDAILCHRRVTDWQAADV